MPENIILTTNGAHMFLSWLEKGDGALLSQILCYPGYRAVIQHSGTWGNAITATDMVNAVNGKPSPMYGLFSVRDDFREIWDAIGCVEAHRNTSFCWIPKP